MNENDQQARRKGKIRQRIRKENREWFDRKVTRDYDEEEPGL